VGNSVERSMKNSMEYFLFQNLISEKTFPFSLFYS
jgi:hypothetical protein